MDATIQGLKALHDIVIEVLLLPGETLSVLDCQCAGAIRIKELSVEDCILMLSGSDKVIAVRARSLLHSAGVKFEEGPHGATWASLNCAD